MIIEGKKNGGERKDCRMKEKDPKIKSSDTPRFKIAQGILDSQWRLRKSVKEPRRQSRECGIPEIKKGECFRITWLVM